ncbi:hypothetical protein DL96DRAFT_1825368 [Flagelloscypha sp. PMI_526]|nr:hypothetical protein DL96DRAFT_1825368 [Flagelloscypha sp. PMI_526]
MAAPVVRDVLSLGELIERLQKSPDLIKSTGFNQCCAVVDATSALKQQIIGQELRRNHNYDPTGPPNRLSTDIIVFVSSQLGIKSNVITKIWDAFREVIWSRSEYSLTAERLRDSFRAAGFSRKLSELTLYPPNRCCIQQDCPNEHHLLEELHPIVLFTFNDGPRATYEAVLTCNACKTMYYHNYFTTRAEKSRTYYSGVPEAIETTKHHFFETNLARLFVNLLVMSWTSATNFARVYELSMTDTEVIDAASNDWQGRSFRMTTDNVWNAFFILALLEDHQLRDSVLIVPNEGSQPLRFQEAIAERNYRIRTHGQVEKSHFCDKCCRWIEENDRAGERKVRKVHALVIDGITLGRPCCSAANCASPLPTTRHHFCAQHASMKNDCCVEGCNSKAEVSWNTCSLESHRNLEKTHRQRNTAMFQLKAKLQRAAVSVPDDALDPEATSDDVEECPEKPEDGNVKIKARFGRRRTHNEQIMVRPCGIIVARKTFFGAESLTEHRAMIKEEFEERDEDLMPDVIFYDNNCRLYRHLRHNNDDLIHRVCLPVDVFHWMCKHKKTDIECSEHCNPWKFSELRGEAGIGWYFNSSAAEQTNVWLGGYHSILREMRADRYDFVLDELIYRRNRIALAKLEEDIGLRVGHFRDGRDEQ